jgi:hypothetical protein
MKSTPGRCRRKGRGGRAAIWFGGGHRRRPRSCGRARRGRAIDFRSRVFGRLAAKVFGNLGRLRVLAADRFAPDGLRRGGVNGGHRPCRWPPRRLGRRVCGIGDGFSPRRSVLRGNGSLPVGGSGRHGSCRSAAAAMRAGSADGGIRSALPSGRGRG